MPTTAAVRLKEAELATEFGVSRTPVRDALSRISHLGLVETRNGVGTVVVALTDTQIRHVYDMRLELAGLIGRVSPNAITDRHRQSVKAMLATAHALSGHFDVRRYVEVNHDLHELIASLIGNETLRAFWWQTYYQAASTWHRVGTLLGADAAQALEAELLDVATALDHDDAEAIGYIQRTHIGYGYKRIKTHILGSEEVLGQS